MKKLLITLFALGVMMGTTDKVKADVTDHPNWGQINAFVSAMHGTVAGLQTAYFVREDAYFQGLPLLGDDSMPDGTVEVPILYSRNPHDQIATWQDFGPALFKPGLDIPINYRIDVYTTGNGWGYVETFEFYYEGLGPDQFGRDGSHWILQIDNGVEEFPGLIEGWYVLPEIMEP